LSAQDDARAVDELRFPPLEVRKGDVFTAQRLKHETHAKSSTGWSSIAFGVEPLATALVAGSQGPPRRADRTVFARALQNGNLVVAEGLARESQPDQLG
jgi:hypothetical protein